MDAKAKVVNMLAVFDFELAGWEDGSEPYEDLWAARCEYVRLAGIEEAHERLITDHEAAMAELSAENHRLRVENHLKTRAIDRWVPCPDHRDKTNDQGCYMCQLERANKRTEQLLTGLEALAQRMDRLARMDRADGDECAAARVETFAEELRTLTNSAKAST